MQKLIDTREQKVATGYVVYIGRSLGEHKTLDHGTDMLRAITAAALETQENLEDREAKSGARWAEANPFNVQELTWRWS